MTRLRTFFGLVPLFLTSAAACSAGGGGKNAGLTGDGGSSAAGDSGGSTVGSGGSGATGTGGSSGTLGGSSMIELGGSGGDTAGTAGVGPICSGLTAHSTRLVPTVLLLVDNSSSMFDKTSAGSTSWKLLYDALMDKTNGPVAALQDDIRFGFASYQGHQASSEDDPACATITPTMSTFSLNNYAAIDQVYTELGSEVNMGANWETPTGYAIKTVTPELAAFTSDPPGPKYILLVTDGNPNTCKTINPQCGQDRTIKAVQDAFAQGIGTIPFGIGDIVVSDDGCNVMQARCGNDHLQDIANAGAGLPVQAPPADYKYQPCIQGEGGTVTATYVDAGQTSGTAQYFTANDSASLQKQLAQALMAVQSCTFDLDALVTGNPAGGIVTLNGNALTFGDMAGGWTLESNKYQVTLQGSACEAFRTNQGSTLSVEFPCDKMGKPIAEPR
jgi:hypothetical protein